MKEEEEIKKRLEDVKEEERKASLPSSSRTPLTLTTLIGLDNDDQTKLISLLRKIIAKNKKVKSL